MSAHLTTATGRGSVTRKALALATFVGIIVGLMIVMATSFPLGADYFYTYRPVTENWLNGKTRLYDDHALGYFNAPWAVMLLVPTALMPIRIGQAVLNTVSMLGLLLSIHLFRQERTVRAYVVVLLIANMHTIDLIIRGQIDSILLVAITLGWWSINFRRPWMLSLALCLLAIKPLNVMLVSMLFLYSIRSWSRHDLLIVFSLPGLAILTSPLIAGLDWPLRYFDFVRQYPVSAHRSITIWRIGAQLNLPEWPFAILAVLLLAAWIRTVTRDGLTLWTLSVALVLNLLFTVYANGYHYLLLTPALLLIGSTNSLLLFVAYITTWMPLVRLGNESIMHWDYLYPITIFCSLIFVKHVLCFSETHPQSFDPADQRKNQV